MKEISSTEIMGLCVAMINKELAKQSRLVESRIPTNLLTECSLRSVEEKFDKRLQEVDESSIKSLPDGIIFDVHLKDAMEASGRALETVVDEINETYSDLYEKLSKKLTLASNNHMELTEQYSQYKENLHYILESLDQADESAKAQLSDLLEADEEIRSSISVLSQQLNASLQNSIDSLNKGIFDLGSEVDQNKKLVDVKLSELKSDILSVSKEITQTENKLQSGISAKTTTITGQIQSLSVDVKTTNDSLNLLGSELRSDIESAVQKLETEYSKIGHDHSQYAHVSDLQILQSKQSDHSSALKLQASTVADIINDVKSKIDIKDGLTKSDLESVKQDIADKVEQRIPTPKNGKDALNWEFKFDDRNVGVLMFRREDQTRWQRQNIRGPRGLQGMSGSSYGGMGAGGGGVTTLEGKFNLTVQDEGVEVSDTVTSINFIGEGVEAIPSSDGNVTVKVNGSEVIQAALIVEEVQLSGNSQAVDIRDFGYSDYYSYKIVDQNNQEVSIIVKEDNLIFIIESIVPMDSLRFIVRGF